MFANVENILYMGTAVVWRKSKWLINAFLTAISHVGAAMRDSDDAIVSCEE